MKKKHLISATILATAFIADLSLNGLAFADSDDGKSYWDKTAVFDNQGAYGLSPEQRERILQDYYKNPPRPETLPEVKYVARPYTPNSQIEYSVNRAHFRNELAAIFDVLPEPIETNKPMDSYSYIQDIYRGINGGELLGRAALTYKYGYLFVHFTFKSSGHKNDWKTAVTKILSKEKVSERVVRESWEESRGKYPDYIVKIDFSNDQVMKEEPEENKAIREKEYKKIVEFAEAFFSEINEITKAGGPYNYNEVMSSKETPEARLGKCSKAFYP